MLPGSLLRTATPQRSACSQVPSWPPAGTAPARVRACMYVRLAHVRDLELQFLDSMILLVSELSRAPKGVRWSGQRLLSSSFSRAESGFHERVHGRVRMRMLVPVCHFKRNVAAGFCLCK